MKTPKSNPYLILVGWWLFLGIVNAFWLHYDTRPPDWDPFKHLAASLRYFHVQLSPGAALHRIHSLLEVDDFYPPLAPLAVSFFYYLVPSDTDTATWVLNQLFLGILLFSVYGLGKHLYTPDSGLMASIAVTSFPALLMQSRIFMLDLPVTAMTAMGMYALVRTEEFGTTKSSMLFGLAAGLATMTKWSFLFFIFLPFVYTFARIFPKPDRLLRLMNAAASLVVWGLVTLPWFLAHFSSLIFTSIKFGYQVGVHEGDPEVLSVRSLIYYLSELPDQIFIPWIILTLAGLYFYIRRDCRKNPILLLWIVGGYAILTLLRNKDARYVLPYLPALAIIATAWPGSFKGAVRRVGLLLFSGLSLFTVGYQLYSNPPVDEPWPIRDAYEFIQTQVAHHPRPRVRVIPDAPYFERHGFEYYAERAQSPMDVTTWVRFPTFTDFVVLKTGDQGVEHDAVTVMEQIQRDPEGFDAVFKSKWERPLPDGSIGRVYVRDITPVAGIDSHTLISKFKEALARYIGQYVTDPQGWSVDVETFSDSDTLRGRFRIVRFSMTLATLRDKNGRATPMTLHDLGMELSDLTINPVKLIRDGNLEVISLMEATPRVSIRESDLNSYLSGLGKGWQVQAELQDGRVRIHVASRRWIPSLDLDLEPFLVSGENFGFSFRQVRLGGFPFPTVIPQVLTAKFNPVLKPMPCRMRMRTLRIENGSFILNG